MSARLAALQKRLLGSRTALLEHPIYTCLDRPEALRCFMEHHVFAVWDFMSLLKALQRRYTCVYVPWTPSANATIARFINEIVIGEETDSDGHGGFASHFDLYRRAMKQFGANAQPIDALNQAIHVGGDWKVEIEDASIPAPARQFVKGTFALIESSDPVALLAAFTFGREDLLPAVFQQIVNQLNVDSGGGLEEFQYYLQRHIGLDGDEHGPMAHRLVEMVCGEADQAWRTVEAVATESLQARLLFWDGIAAALPS